MALLRMYYQAKNPAKHTTKNPGKHAPRMDDAGTLSRPEVQVNRVQNGLKPYNLGLNVTPDDTPLWTLCRSTHVRLCGVCDEARDTGTGTGTGTGLALAWRA